MGMSLLEWGLLYLIDVGFDREVVFRPFAMRFLSLFEMAMTFYLWRAREFKQAEIESMYLVRGKVALLGLFMCINGNHFIDSYFMIKFGVCEYILYIEK